MSQARKPQFRIGCSGWNYKSWKGTFYPRSVAAAGWLEYYTTVFDTVEVNNTFYRLPDASTFAAWRRRTPASFLMAVKASRFITHIKRLRDPADAVDRLFSRASALGSRLGPVLYQLPATLQIDLPRLEEFLTALPRKWTGTRKPRGSGLAAIRHVVEFRHPSWYVPETFALLEQHGAAWCLHDKRGSPLVKHKAGPFLYVRFHGSSGEYRGSYSPRALDAWAHRLAEQWLDGRDVFAYFNNDPDAVATENAMSLRKRARVLLEGIAAIPRSLQPPSRRDPCQTGSTGAGRRQRRRRRDE